MTFHLYGNILTGLSIAANNRGDNDSSNITKLQKLFWNGEEHTFVSSEAIRWALRYYWQTACPEEKVNRVWNEKTNNCEWQSATFNAETYIDDDVLGFMKAEGARTEAGETEEAENEVNDNKPKKNKGQNIRRGILELNRGVSTIPFQGELTFNARSGEKNSNSLYSTEFHSTRYQFCFAMTPNKLHVIKRVLATLEGLTHLSNVAGNHSRFLYDFSPDSLVLRWSHDFAPRILYCFEQEDNKIDTPSLVYKLENKDIQPNEIYIGGAFAATKTGDHLKKLGCHVFGGVKQATNALLTQIKSDLKLK